MTKTAFILSAGFGTRFQPHTNFLPKPAIPFFGIPQALYPTGLLKNIGVDNFIYNSHHLPKELDQNLKPFFRSSSIFEPEILDSAGGIANAKDSILNNNNDDNFWVVNGDSFITCSDTAVLQEAYDFHLKTDSVATLIGITKNNPHIGGLGFNSDNAFTHISKDESCLHFVGLYIFNNDIFNHIQKKKEHIFTDVLLNNFSQRVSVFNAQDRLAWYETGNEKDFINCHHQEALNILKEKELSSIFKTHEAWGVPADQKLAHFLENKVWGSLSHTSPKSKFLVLPDAFSFSSDNLTDCVVVNNLETPLNQTFKERVLIDSSQWA